MRYLGLAFLLCLYTLCSHADRIKDIASIAGVRPNHLIGYGLVVGLDGSGDQTTQLPFSATSVSSLLAHMGINVPPNNPGQVKNAAVVIVTTELPAFIRPGQQIDVIVSSVGNAKSLRGGTLLMTPLKGVDGQIYAIAQGSVIVGGISAQGPNSSTQINHTSVGRIPNGAQVERMVPINLSKEPYVDIELNQEDFQTATHVATAIDRRFHQKISTVVDGRLIRVTAPADSTNRAQLISNIQALDVTLAPAKARVVINSRTGSVVMTSQVTIDECAVAHGNITVSISSEPQVSQPNMLSGGTTTVTAKDTVTIASQAKYLVRLKSETSLADVVRALNIIGANPQDLISILQAMKAAGSLHADLEIL